MEDVFNVLEERTRTWHALQRQGLADEIWQDYVSVRFGRTGDPRGLEYLYPYLNHADRGTRLRAIDVAGRVFAGRGPRAVEQLDYFTGNPDLFLRDRAVIVVGSAVAGSPDTVILETLQPYLSHRNQFIRKLALVALGKAAAGQASATVLAEIQRLARMPGPRPDEVDTAIATVFSGHPTEDVYRLAAKPELADRIDTGNEGAVAVLVRGASDEWYERACEEVFEPRLHAREDTVREKWMTAFVWRDGVGALIEASPGRGMSALQRMLHLRHHRCPAHALVHGVGGLFRGADRQANLGALVDLARDGDVPSQRIACRCLGALMDGSADPETMAVLEDLCGAKNKAVQAAALDGLGAVARSSCQEQVRRLCLERAQSGETAAPAIRALGRTFQGSGHAEVFADIRKLADAYRARPVRGKKHCKPLAQCYLATGALHHGTGSTEPVDFLLDAVALPRTRQYGEYRACAAMALVMVEFTEAALSAADVHMPI